MKKVLLGGSFLSLVILVCMYFGQPYLQNNTDSVRSFSKDNVMQSSLLHGNKANVSNHDLNTEEISGLFKMKEGQKLGLDVNLRLHEKWALEIFKTVANKKMDHGLMITFLLVDYNLTDYNGSEKLGVFHREALQKSYNRLEEKGSSSLENALAVGAEIEELMLQDLMYQLDSVMTHQDIKNKFEQFKKESEKDLFSFVQLLESQHVVYQAKHLSKSAFQEIIKKQLEVVVDNIPPS